MQSIDSEQTFQKNMTSSSETLADFQWTTQNYVPEGRTHDTQQ